MGREDGARKNEMSVGPNIKELQIPSVASKLSCKQQKVYRIDFVLEGKPEVGVLTLHQVETNHVREHLEADCIGAGVMGCVR